MPSSSDDMRSKEVCSSSSAAGSEGGGIAMVTAVSVAAAAADGMRAEVCSGLSEPSDGSGAASTCVSISLRTAGFGERVTPNHPPSKMLTVGQRSRR